MAETNLPGDASLRLDLVRSYRSGYFSRMADTCRGVLAAALRAKSRVTSHPAVVRLVLFGARVGFLADFASDGLVAKTLVDSGNPTWGGLVIALMVLPYVVMVAVLFPLASKKLGEMSRWPRHITAAFWVLGGIPACAVADVWYNLRYFCSDPASVQEFHYMTLRSMAELLEAQLQLILQSYIGLRQWNPLGVFPAVEGAHINPLVLGASIAISACTTYQTYARLKLFADNQSGGNKLRFLWHMSHLGAGLAPSNLFQLVGSRRSLVITYDLTGVALKEMKRLGIMTKRAKQLKELTFEDASWISSLVSPTVSEQVVNCIVRDLASAPNLQRLELRSSQRIPAWAFGAVKNLAKSHRGLKEAHLHGHSIIQGDFVRNLTFAHPLLRASHGADLAAVRSSGTAPLPLETHAAALALAAFSDSLELLRCLLLHPRGLEAMHSPLGRNHGLQFVGDGAVPLHFAAAANNWRATEMLLAARADAQRTRAKGFTPLHEAAMENSAEALEALLAAVAASRGEEHKYLFLEKRNSGGCTALWDAAQENSVACVRQLLFARANPNSQDNVGSTPLVIAAQNDCAASLRLILQAHGDPNIAKSDGATPTLMAAQHDSVECLNLLLAKGADVNKATNTGFIPGATPVFVAARNNNLKCLKLLLAKGGSANRAARDGKPPLIVAVEEDRFECVEVLLRARANPDAVWGNMTALDWAQHQGHSAAAAVLRRHQSRK